MVDQALLDNLRHDSPVFSSDSEEVGKLHSVVIDPRDDEVTHIVVNAGPFFPAPGFGAPTLISVSIDDMADAQEEGVILKITKQKFEGYEEYVERDFLPHPEQAAADGEAPHRGLARIVWDTGAALAASIGNQLVGIPVPRETFQKAKFERNILNDTPVWRQEPHEELGEVDRLLVDEINDDVEALVIRRGHVFGEDKILPIEYVTEVLDGVVRVQLSDEEIAGLESFEAD